MIVLVVLSGKLKWDVHATPVSPEVHKEVGFLGDQGVG